MRPDTPQATLSNPVIPAKAGIKGCGSAHSAVAGILHKTMLPVAEVHTLLHLADLEALVWEARRPDWAPDALQLAPWVVVRRTAPRPGLWPVGVRGEQRLQRCAAWLPGGAVRHSLSPRQLAVTRPWHLRPAAQATPAIAALDEVEAILEAHGFTGRWGPGGSAGYELASGLPCTTPHSDLDLVLYAPLPPAREHAVELHSVLSRLPVRIDALLETPNGAVALAEYARAGDMLLRSANGPRLVSDPWRDEAAVAGTVAPGA
jgi:phosphoribosyl-dephospho-CoA transferase